MNEEKNPSIPARFRNIELTFTVESAEKLLEGLQKLQNCMVVSRRQKNTWFPLGTLEGLIFALEDELDEVEYD